MGVINTGSVAKAMWPGQRAFYGEGYDEWAPEFPDLYEEVKSEYGYEEITGLSGFGLPKEKSEMDSIQFGEASQSFTHRLTNKTYTHGYILSLEAIEDAIASYKISFLGKDKAQALAFSMRQGKEVLAALPYNRAFNASYTYADGVEMCSLLHPKKAGGTFANKPTVDADISELAIEQAIIDIAGMADDAGMKIALKPLSLHCHYASQFNVTRILESVLQNDSANNAVNALKKMGIFSEGAKFSHYFTGTGPWFIRNKLPKGTGMIYLNRIDNDFGMDNDFNTTNAKYRARFRCAFGPADPLAIYGVNGP